MGRGGECRHFFLYTLSTGQNERENIAVDRTYVYSLNRLTEETLIN